MNIIDRKLLVLFVTIIAMLTILSVPTNSKLGEIYFKSFKYDLALEYYNKSRALDSNSPQILRQLKEYFLVQGEIEKALQMQNRLCDVLTRSQKDLIELSKLYEWNNMPFESLRTKERLARLLPTDERNELLLEVTNGYRWLRKYDDADRISEQLDQTDKKQYLLSTLEYYVSTSNFPKVIELTNKIKRQGINSKRFKLLQAQSFEAQQKIRDAVIAYKKYLSEDESFHSYDAYKIIPSAKFYAENLRTYEKIIFLHQQNKDEEILVNLYLEIFEKVPTDYEIALSAAVLLYKEKRILDLKEVLERVYKSRRSKDLYRTGDIYRLLNEPANAARHLEKAYALSPNNIEVIEALADVYEDMGKNKKALRLQYILLKLLEKRESPRSSLLYIYNSEIYAQFSGPVPVSRNRTRIKKTQKKILYLLEKIGDKEERHKELLRFVELYPLDTDVRVELAYSFMERGDSKSALTQFNKIYEINNQDRDAVLFLVDSNIQQGDYKSAAQKLDNIVHRDNDFDILNRKESVYRITKEADANIICAKVLDRKNIMSDYSFIDLKARCLDQNGEANKASELLVEYLRTNPKNMYAKVSLGYYLIKSDRYEAAKSLANSLKAEYPKDRDVISLEREVIRAESYYLRKRAWVFSSYVHLFSNRLNGLSYWDADFKITKNFYPFSLGVSYSVQDPFYFSENIDDFKLHIGYEKADKYSAQFHVGQNQKNDSQTNFGASFYFIHSTKYASFLSADYNRQVFDINTFNQTHKPLHDELEYTLSHSFDSKNDLTYTFGYSRYKIYEGSQNHEYAQVAFSWMHQYSDRFSFGPYLYERHTLSSELEITSSLPDFVSTQCLALKYWHKLREFQSNRSYSNRTESCIGISRINGTGVGSYINLRNTTNIYIDAYQEYEIRFELDQSAFQNLNQIYSLYFGYNRWFF